MTNQEILALEPRPVWKLFAEIAAIPRPSRQEDRIRAHLRTIFEKQRWPVREDAVGNMVATVPASPACENAPLTVLQAHVDMVCEKNASTKHDFQNDPIRLRLDRENGEQIVRADGTTLGADNGIGVAAALAAALSPDVRHGPLEILLTIDEETGMTGAKSVTPDLFRGRRMLNLDGEEDTEIYIGCAGGADTTLTLSLPTEAIHTDMEIVQFSVDGLRGGHSGADIHENRGNAIQLLARTLLRLEPESRLVSLSGGNLRNAIPREARAVLIGGAGLLAAAEQLAAAAQADLRRELAGVDEGIRLTAEVATGGEGQGAISGADTDRVLSMLVSLPHGVLGLHPRIPGLVETSNNVSSVKAPAVAQGQFLKVEVATLSRSSSAPRLHAVLSQIKGVGILSGATAASGNQYPGWEPNPDSPLLAACRRVYEQVCGKPPHVTAIHAGLECGIIGDRIGKMDMVSFGPNIRGAHSPDERVYVASVQRFWKFLTALLAELSRG